MYPGRSSTPQKSINRAKADSNQNSSKRRSFQKTNDKENHLNSHNAVYHPGKKDVKAFNATGSLPKKKALKLKKYRSKSAARGTKATQEDALVMPTQVGFEYETAPAHHKTDIRESKIYYKIGDLQKSIESQEETLMSLQKQIEFERVELGEITEKINRKNDHEHDLKRRSYLNEPENDSHHIERVQARKPPQPHQGTFEKISNRSIDHKSDGTSGSGHRLSLKKSSENENTQKSRISSMQALKQIVERSEGQNIKKHNSMVQYFQKSKLDEPNLPQSTDENHEQLQENVNDYKRLFKMTKEKNELVVKELRDELRALSKENSELRDKYTHSEEEPIKKLERIYKNRIKGLEAQLQQDKSSEDAYKHQIDEINQKLVRFESQIQKNAQLEAQVKHLTRQLREKEEELQEVNRSQTEKLRTIIDKQTNQKKEWSKVYSELLAEIKTLKVEMDILSENKRVSTLDTSAYIKTSEYSSNRLGF